MKLTTIYLFLLMIMTTMYSNAQEPVKNILSEYVYPTKYIILDDQEIAYIQEGNGPETIVLVHGLSSNVDAWQKNIEAFSKDYQVIATDLPGFGKSTKQNDFAYTPTFYANIIKQLLDKFRLDKVHLVGHSMGGQAAIKFATLYPENLSKLILVAPAGIEKFDDYQSLMIKKYVTVENIVSSNEEQIKNNYKLNFFEMPIEAEKMVQDRINIRSASDFNEYVQAVVKSVHGMLDEPVFDALQSIHCPTMIIFGKNDQLIPNTLLNANLTTEQIADLAMENIPNSELLMVDKAGHFVMLEQFDIVNQAMLTFLQD